jgi:hypothetical protein
MGHTPGRGHRRKSDPAKKKRFRKKADNRKIDLEKRYNEAKREWARMSENARKLRPELDPELLKPAGRKNP